MSDAPVPEAAKPETPKPSLLGRLPGWAVPAVLVGVPLLVWLATLVEPTLYRDFVWKYYWGPIKADASGQMTLYFDGVAAHSGYNVVNTLTWAALLGTCIVGLAQMLRRLKSPMDDRLILGATAWVVTGSVFHVVEDVDTFQTPLQYLFITPPIYLLFGAFGIASLFVGHYLKAVAEKAGVERALAKLWFLHVVLVILWLAFWLKPWGQITAYVNPAWVAAFAAVNFLVTRVVVLRMGRVDPSTLTLTLALGAFLLSMAYVVSFELDPWSPSGEGMPLSFLYAPALAGAVALAVFLVARARNAKKPGPIPAAYLAPINLLLVFSQAVDGFATALGIDVAGYTEKHVLSAKVIDAMRDASTSAGFDFGATYPTFLAFVPLKILVSLLVVYVIDISSKEDKARHPTLIGLVKFAIIMVGIGPGVRDFTRLSLGV